ncbi:glycosyl hydrolase family 8 [Alloyangia pacifica]|uniref:glycosyl hydrolase family 8 n=1 Tax=Alloyangia pacifica TaxID=311180 RepID=UPI001CD6207E|nr:glycosyl hydrolase family 8 [Alloyangia pacifica]MCA0995525.1 glycosyl hydrolase family 5 [Alloyangia pacifica]
MDRRNFLAGLTALTCSAAPAATAESSSEQCWRLWRARFMQPDGRVIDDLQGGTSHSEGQGYGLLLAQAHGDERSFRNMEEWTAHNLAIRDDRLMAWQWIPRRRDNIEDWHNATDGDLFRAWALLRAARDSGWHEYYDTAMAIARDIARLCLAPDPRAPQELILRPGAEARMAPNRVLFNPSYIMPRALRELGEAAGEPKLIRAADHGERLLAELAREPVLPDWIDVTEAGFDAPQEHELRSSYDAIRIPLYLTWSGRTAHPAVASALAGFDAAGPGGKVAVALGPAGKVRAVSDSAGYRAIAALARCAPLPPATRQDSAQSYYPATLQLLANVAVRERGSC